MDTKNNMNSDTSVRPYIWFGIIAACLVGFNTIASTVGLGVAQLPLVAFSSPFALALGKLLYPRLTAAIAIYTPLVIVSFFTFNLGPPGLYKVTFLVAPILYDLSTIGLSDSHRVPLWRLIIAVWLYALGLLVGALLAISFFGITLPLTARFGVAVGGTVFLAVIGSFATWAAHHVYYRWVAPEDNLRSATRKKENATLPKERNEDAN